MRALVERPKDAELILNASEYKAQSRTAAISAFSALRANGRLTRD